MVGVMWSTVITFMMGVFTGFDVMYFVVRKIVFIHAVKVVSSMVVEHVMVTIWVEAMVVVGVIMEVSWVFVLPMSITVMVANIVMLVTCQVFLSVTVMMVCWLSSHWSHMSVVVNIMMQVMVFIWLHL